ncbi:putative carboxylesterase 7 [Bienertia sinuspersici]
MKKEEENRVDTSSSELRLFYKKIRRQRIADANTHIPPCLDPKTGVESKDINISYETGVYVRLYKPKKVDKKSKMPLLLYFHGGGFCMDSTYSSKYHNHLNQLAAEAQAMIVSVEYRRTPEHRLPAAYNDGWDALNWVFNSNTRDYQSWIQEHVDFGRVYLMGDSAGANIAHQLALRGKRQNQNVVSINGIILVHPYFWGSQRIGHEACNVKNKISHLDIADKFWALARPSNSMEADHPWINPGNDPCLSSLGCNHVLVLIAQNDLLRGRGLYYKEVLEKSGWQGTVEVVESIGEDHTFHLAKPFADNTFQLIEKVVAFLYPLRSTL